MLKIVQKDKPFQIQICMTIEGYMYVYLLYIYEDNIVCLCLSICVKDLRSTEGVPKYHLNLCTFLPEMGICCSH